MLAMQPPLLLTLVVWAVAGGVQQEGLWEVCACLCVCVLVCLCVGLIGKCVCVLVCLYVCLCVGRVVWWQSVVSLCGSVGSSRGMQQDIWEVNMLVCVCLCVYVCLCVGRVVWWQSVVGLCGVGGSRGMQQGMWKVYMLVCPCVCVCVDVCVIGGVGFDGKESRVCVRCVSGSKGYAARHVEGLFAHLIYSGTST
jgi:hypothetical protein